MYYLLYSKPFNRKSLWIWIDLDLLWSVNVSSVSWSSGDTGGDTISICLNNFWILSFTLKASPFAKVKSLELAASFVLSSWN